MKKSRRTFLKTTAVAGTALAINPVPIFADGYPSKKIRVAVMGIRSRGLHLAKSFAQMKDTEVATICDVDKEYLERGLEELGKIQGTKPKGEKDIRKVLEDKDIDALVVAAPDHWHAPAAIMALKAGKHVYLEKPCSHNPREGELLIEADKKHNRVLQMGNQRRSWPNTIQAIQDIRSGIIGEVYFGKAWYANDRKPIGFGKVVPVPEKLDWDLFQGPAPRVDFRDNIHPYNWHWFWHWGTGEALNNGTHEIDILRWGMDLDYPTRVVASGGRYHYKDDWECPDTMVINFDFEVGKSISWEQRSCNFHKIENDSRGVIFHGVEGTMVLTANGYSVYRNDRSKTLIKEVKPENNSNIDSTNTASPDSTLDGVHVANFLSGIRDGVAINSPILGGHKSVLMCQLGNIAWRTGNVLNIDQRNGRIIGDPYAMSFWSRDYEPGWEPII